MQLWLLLSTDDFFYFHWIDCNPIYLKIQKACRQTLKIFFSKEKNSKTISNEWVIQTSQRMLKLKNRHREPFFSYVYVWYVWRLERCGCIRDTRMNANRKKLVLLKFLLLHRSDIVSTWKYTSLILHLHKDYNIESKSIDRLTWKMRKKIANLYALVFMQYCVCLCVCSYAWKSLFWWLFIVWKMR